MTAAKDNKHVTNFKKNHLQQGESVKTWGEGYIGNIMGKGKDTQHNGVLLVTDVRVAFYRKGLLGEVVENIPLKLITSIERKSMLGHRVIKLHTSHDDLAFKTFSKETELSIIEAIEAGRGLKVDAPDTAAPVSSPVATHDPYEQLKKLSELKSAGIISEEEYQQKREKLLQLI